MTISLDTRLQDVQDFSHQLKKRFADEYMDNIRSLLQYSRRDLEKAGFGSRTIDKIEAFLALHGFSLSKVNQTMLPPRTSDEPAHPGAKRGIGPGTPLGRRQR